MGNELTSACSGARDKAPACALNPCRADCAGWQVRHALAPAYGLVAANAEETTKQAVHVTRLPIVINAALLSGPNCRPVSHKPSRFAFQTPASVLQNSFTIKHSSEIGD